MNIINLLLALTGFLATATAALTNHTQEFHLKTALKPGQDGKEDLDGLWLEAYHTGAGLNDAVMVPEQSAAIKGFLNGTNGKVDGTNYQNLVFDLGNSFPWDLIMAENVNFYAAWEPVQVNAGEGSISNGGFWINENGLQWTDALNAAPSSNTSSFGGWLGRSRNVFLYKLPTLTEYLQCAIGGMAHLSSSFASHTTPSKSIRRLAAVRMFGCAQSTSEADLLKQSAAGQLKRSVCPRPSCHGVWELFVA